MRKENKIFTYIMIVLGNLIVAASVSFFVLPNNVLSGGVAGVAVALQPIIPINPVLMIDGLTVILFIIGYIFLGKRFALRTLLSTIIYPVGVSIMSYIVSLFPEGTFIVESYLASIYAGLLSGVGLGLCFRANASTGGMDIPALMIHKYTKISSGDSVAIVDVLTIVLGLATYGLEPALIGILSVFASTVSINRTVLLGSQKAINAMVISDKWNEIKTFVINDMNITVTELRGVGGYSQEDKMVLMIVIREKMYPYLESAIKDVDPHAFVIINNVNEVLGEGYTYGDLEPWKK